MYSRMVIPSYLEANLADLVRPHSEVCISWLVNQPHILPDETIETLTPKGEVIVVC